MDWHLKSKHVIHLATINAANQFLSTPINHSKAQSRYRTQYHNTFKICGLHVKPLLYKYRLLFLILTSNNPIHQNRYLVIQRFSFSTFWFHTPTTMIVLSLIIPKRNQTMYALKRNMLAVNKERIEIYFNDKWYFNCFWIQK